MKLSIQVPVEVEVEDYHEFYDIQDVLHLLSPTLRVKEIAFHEENGMYVGVIYSGSLKDYENAKFIKSVKEKYEEA